MLTPITYKRVYDSEGNFEELEIWQGGQHITINFHPETTHFNGARWHEVKEAIEKQLAGVRAVYNLKDGATEDSDE